MYPLLISRKGVFMEEVYELNDGHIVEAVDRIHVAASYLEDFLAGHPLIHSVNEFREDVERATDILADLYQKIAKYEEVSALAREHEIGKGYEIAK